MAELELRKGQRYRTREPIAVRFLTHWLVPITTGGEGTLPAGEVFVIALDPPANATAAGCNAERSKEIERMLVPEANRSAPKYGGFSLVIDFETIRTKCERTDAR